jgi:hypothetical protein
MNDYDTRSIVFFILSLMGYHHIAKSVKDSIIDLDRCIRLIKIKSSKFPHLIDMIDYFL